MPQRVTACSSTEEDKGEGGVNLRLLSLVIGRGLLMNAADFHLLF